MDTVVTMMLVFWGAMLATYFLIQRGLWIFGDVTRGMTAFMLEKALGPGSDLVEGRAGSGAQSWISQGTLWLLASSLLTFESLWLSHDPNALHALASWGYTPSAEALSTAGEYSILYGSVGMFLIGSGFHIVPKLAGTELASEKNATLVSFAWSGSVLFMIIASHASEIFGVPIFLIALALHVLVLVAVVANLLLTITDRTSGLPMPAWLIVLGLTGGLLTGVVALATCISTGMGQWMGYHMIGSTFFFATISGVTLYAASVMTGNALWSRTLTGVVLIGSFLTINPLGATDGSLFVDLFGPLAEGAELDPTQQDKLVASILMAFAFIPIIAYVGNMLITMRGGDAADAPNSAGAAEMNLGAWLLVPVSIGALFVQTDAISGAAELSGLSDSMSLLAIWAVVVPLSTGAALSLYPAITGRNLMSQTRARWGFWLMAGGALFGISITMVADFVDMALAEMLVEDPSALAEDLRKTGSVMFYGTVIGAILHSINMIQGMFRGELVDSVDANSSSITADSYSLASPMTVRRILGSGAGLDTEVVPVAQSEEKGSATEL